jgi:hypothetical protein
MDALLAAVTAGVKVYDLGQPLEAAMPVSPNHPPFRSALMRRHGDSVRADGSSAANDLFTSGTHVGTHVDALSHVSLDDHLFGGASASEAQRGGRFASHGIEQMPPLVRRGVLLDIPRLKGVDCLEPEPAPTSRPPTGSRRRAPSAPAPRRSPTSRSSPGAATRCCPSTSTCSSSRGSTSSRC